MTYTAQFEADLAALSRVANGVVDAAPEDCSVIERQHAALLQSITDRACSLRKSKVGLGSDSQFLHDWWALLEQSNPISAAQIVHALADEDATIAEFHSAIHRLEAGDLAAVLTEIKRFKPEGKNVA